MSHQQTWGHQWGLRNLISSYQFHYTRWLTGIPLLDYYNPQYGGIIPYNHQSTEVLNTAQLNIIQESRS